MRYTIILLFFTQALFAQSSGSIDYEQVIKFEITDDMPPIMKTMKIPDSKNSFKLTYNEEASLYQNIVSEAPESNSGVIFMGGDAAYFFHVDKIKKQTTEQQEFLGKRFLISDNWEKPKWKITSESKIILGHPCLKAIQQDSSTNIEAWFAMDIKVPYGPRSYGQLPGLILEITNGIQTIKAIKISFEEPAPFKKPKKGKKVTAEEYEIIQKKKLEELKSEQPGNKSHVITIGG